MPSIWIDVLWKSYFWSYTILFWWNSSILRELLKPILHDALEKQIIFDYHDFIAVQVHTSCSFESTNRLLRETISILQEFF